MRKENKRTRAYIYIYSLKKSIGFIAETEDNIEYEKVQQHVTNIKTKMKKRKAVSQTQQLDEED